VRILAISAHPDDETLGCGGTLLKHRAAGDDLFGLIVTQTHEPQWSAETIEHKATEIEQVVEAYGMKECFELGFPSTRLEMIPHADLIEQIREVISKIKPEVVYLVHGGDVHTDHHAVFTATMSVLKPSYMKHLGVRRVLCYETLSSTEAAPAQLDRAFMPNVFSNIASFIKRKIEIMELYRTEAQADPLPRGSSAIRALACYRGATIGVKHAEAFMLIRELA